MNATTADKIVTIRAKAFANESIREHKVAVDPRSGIVRVWDSIAGFYTNCHRLSRAAQAKSRKLASLEATK